MAPSAWRKSPLLCPIRHGSNHARSGKITLMNTVPTLIGLHTSPFAERVRWAFDIKKLLYERATYRIGEGEEELFKLSGQRQIPVLVAGADVIPDSSAILEWLEAKAPGPALLPDDPALRVQASLYEELALSAIAPNARQLFIGRLLGAGADRAVELGRFFARKYGHSELAERSARVALRRALTVLATALSGRRYLVGDAFSRADLTVSALLLVVRMPPEELFAAAPAWTRGAFDDPLANEDALRSVFAYRDRIYREHRGGRVTG
jgi:glutathione S-transferase